MKGRCEKKEGEGRQRSANERKGKGEETRKIERTVKEGGSTIESLLGGEAIHVGSVVWIIVGRPRSHHVRLLVEGHLLLETKHETTQNQEDKIPRIPKHLVASISSHSTGRYVIVEYHIVPYSCSIIVIRCMAVFEAFPVTC